VVRVLFQLDKQGGTAEIAFAPGGVRAFLFLYAGWNHVVVLDEEQV